MLSREALRVPALALILLLFGAACGQKPGVFDSSAPVGGFAGGGVAIDPETGGIITESGEIIDPETGEVIGQYDGSDSESASGLAAEGDSTDASGGGGNNTSGDQPNTQSEPVTGGDTTGVSSSSIRIGIHAPLTGAAPVPSDSAQKGSDVYWKYLQQQGSSVNGRRVEVIIKNDNYNPSQAVAVCKEMVEKDKVFLLSGAAGTDQIQACARYAGSVGVPYLSAGVTEIGLDNLPTYFATSMSYPAQGPLLTEYLVKKLGAKNKKNAMVYFNTQNFLDARDAFVSAMKKQGIEVYTTSVSKTASAQEAQTVAVDLNQRGMQNVFVLTSPVWFLQLLQASRSQNYAPQWTGIGITMTFDTVAAVGCRNGTLNGAKFFAPFPAWSDSNKYDPEFRKAVQAIYPEKNQGDDFMWLGWAGSKGLHVMFEKVGKELSRERFIHVLQSTKGIKNGITPELNFSPTNHFGATQTHVSEARCSDARWHTIESFKSGF